MKISKMQQRFFRVLGRFPLEIFVWVAALVALKIYNPGRGVHVVVCPLQRAGIDFCPGCGLGRSMACFLDGDFTAAWYYHPLGIFAVIVLLYRIIQLTLNYKNLYGENY